MKVILKVHDVAVGGEARVRGIEWWRCGIYLIAIASCWQAMGQTAGEGGQSPVLMSPYEVSANSVDFQGWRKVKSPNFVLYTDARLKEAHDVLRQLEMVRMAVGAYVRREALRAAPVRVVLPSGRSDWTKIRRKDHVQWVDALSDPAGRLVHLLLGQYDWQERGLYMVHSSEFTRAQLRTLNLRGPFWFEESLGMIFERATVEKAAVVIGHPNPRIGWVVRDGWLPWDRFFRVEENSPEVARTQDVHRLLGQFSAFGQFIMANPDPVWTERMMAWRSLLQAGAEPTEAEFKRIFGHDWKSWQKLMSTYVETGTFQVLTLRFKPEQLKFSFEEVTLPTREMRELFVLSQILNQTIPASATALDLLLAKGLKSEALRELLAEACLKWDRAEEAMVHMKQVIRSGTENPMLLVAAATARFRASIPERTIHSRLSAEAAEEIRDWCRQALAIESRHGEANNLLAWTEALGPDATEHTMTALVTAYRALNGNAPTTGVVAALAVARWRLGEKAGASDLARKLLASPYAEKEFKVLAASLMDVVGSSSDAAPAKPPE